MTTVLIDKNGKPISNGDRVKVRASLAKYPGLYHYAIYTVYFDPIRGMELIFDELIPTEDTNNQIIGTYNLHINKHISIWRWDSDPEKEIVYCRFNIEEGTTFVSIISTNDIELV